MKNKNKTPKVEPEQSDVSNHENEILGVAGAAMGGSIGVMGGPPGVVAGMLVGGAFGEIVGHALDHQHEKRKVEKDARNVGRAKPTSRQRAKP